jgi:hypothetical protein
MKLNINAKELLALHNLLYERFDGHNAHDEAEYKEGDGPVTDEVQLRQVYNRLKACIVGALTSRVVDPVDAWAAHEQAKIDKLNDELSDVKREQAGVAKAVTSPGDLLVPPDDDFTMPDYPRRGSRGGNRGGGGRNKR